jgi:uncharacterized RDD family membrane protein YckC
VRRIIVVLWVIFVAIAFPPAIKETRAILQRPPSAHRSDALRDHIAVSLFAMVAAPLMALAIFGYGVAPRKNAGVTGGPLFVTLWRNRKDRSSKKKSGDRPGAP